MNGGSDRGGRTRGVEQGSDWGSDEMAIKISQISLWFVDMSSDVDVIHPMCSSLGKVNFDLGKITSRSVTIMAKAVTMS